MNNGPDFFSDMIAPQTQVDFFDDIDRQGTPSFIPKTAKRAEGPKTEPGRLSAQTVGLTSKYAKYPLEAVKQLGFYGALADLDEMESRGIPVDREKYIKDLETANEAITGEKVEKYLEEKTGLPLEPKSKEEKAARELFEFASLSPDKILGKLGFGGTSKAIKTYLTENEIPEPLADVISLGMASKIGSKDAGKALQKVSEEKNIGPKGGPPPPGGIEVQVQKPSGPSKETQIGKKYGLRPFSGTEIKEPRGPTPVISREKAKTVKREVTKSAENVVKAIVKDRIPAATAREKGLDLEKAYTHYYDETRKRASASKNLVDTSPIIEWIDNKISSLEKIPSPSTSDQKRLSILRDERKKLRGKKLTAGQTTEQFHAYNENVNASHRKSQMTGLEQAEAETYHAINDELVSAMKKSGNEDVARTFGYANEIFKQTKNLEMTERILQDAFRSPNGLRQILKGKQRGHLEKALGKEGLHHLDQVAKYQTAVFDRMKEFVKVKDPRYLNIRRLWENLSELPGRIAGIGYTGKDIDNMYIGFQKRFLAKDFEAAEKEAEKLLEALGNKTIHSKPKEISSS